MLSVTGSELVGQGVTLDGMGTARCASLKLDRRAGASPRGRAPEKAIRNGRFEVCMVGIVVVYDTDRIDQEGAIDSGVFIRQVFAFAHRHQRRCELLSVGDKVEKRFQLVGVRKGVITDQ